MPIAKLLIVDDDPGIRREFMQFLTQQDYAVVVAADAMSMDVALRGHTFDAIILDVMLPGESGLDICRRLSPRGRTALIIVSAMGGETDRIVGLEMGADDYLPKPCSPRELLARLRALLRRTREMEKDFQTGQDYSFEGWRLDVLRHQLFTPRKVHVALSAGEFRMLTAFLERPQRVLTRETLVDAARGEAMESYDRIVDVTVSRLRRKLSIDGAGGELIRTVRAEGYLFTANVTRVRA